MKKIENYDILKTTMALLPVWTKYGELHTKVVDLYGTLIIADKPLNIIKYNCVENGSSYEGKKEGTRQLTGLKSLLPIAVCEQHDIYMFPTASPKNPECIWLSLSHIYKALRKTSRSCDVLMKNGFLIPISQQKEAVESKINRAARLRSALMDRIKELSEDYKINPSLPPEDDDDDQSDE
ncbi:competence protein ComK [Fictibacillus sp. Mic-4]|uniref:competence protein ComK n=1 Tax=Fictibacillus sp. Mic-4 TaxID=3132826 RepID=UPI003CF20BCB